eukprot:1150961-Pelagomonas_calceolata.AAC.18
MSTTKSCPETLALLLQSVSMQLLAYLVHICGFSPPKSMTQKLYFRSEACALPLHLSNTTYPAPRTPTCTAHQHTLNALFSKDPLFQRPTYIAHQHMPNAAKSKEPLHVSGGNPFARRFTSRLLAMFWQGSMKTHGHTSARQHEGLLYGKKGGLPVFQGCSGALQQISAAAAAQIEGESKRWETEVKLAGLARHCTVTKQGARNVWPTVYRSTGPK